MGSPGRNAFQSNISMINLQFSRVSASVPSRWVFNRAGGPVPGFPDEGDLAGGAQPPPARSSGAARFFGLEELLTAAALAPMGSVIRFGLRRLVLKGSRRRVNT